MHARLVTNTAEVCVSASGYGNIIAYNVRESDIYEDLNNDGDIRDTIARAKLNESLWKKNVYAKNIWRVTQGYIDLGNDAAHGDFDKYDDRSVGNMLIWIRETLLNL